MPILTAEERIGRRVADRYRLDAVVGSGGMGVLFRGFDETTQTPVAVKMLKPTDSAEPDRIARFVRETKIAAMLRHPNVAVMLDSGSDDTGTPFLVMELLEGRSLEEELQERDVLSFAEALAVVVPIANALSAAHALGVIHRDVKPSNIFMCRELGGAAVPKLLDFGIAKSAKDVFETRTGVFVGTPGYVAPEQAREDECGAFTDVWGVGAVVYRCLTGKPPHAAESLSEMLARLVREPVPPLVASGVKRSACATIDRALERDPQRRYQTMRAFVRALETAGAATASDGATDEMPGVATGALETPQPGASTKEPCHRAMSARSWRVFRRAPGFVALGVLALMATIAPRTKRVEAVGADPMHARETGSRERAVSALTVTPVDVAAVRQTGMGVAVALSPLPESSARVTPNGRFRSSPRAHDGQTAPKPAATQAAVATTASLPERDRNTGLPVANEW